MTALATVAMRFGPAGRFELQPLERRLLVDGEPATLGARAFDLLLELASRPGELRSKNELIEAVWPGVIVEEGNLATQISALRKILGGDVIATIPGRGYRFAAQVSSAAPDAPATAAQPVESAAPGATAPPASTPSAPETLRTNLPGDLPPLIGRADDLAALGELVGQHRLVSIVGAGGMGKTRLAQTFLHGRRDAYPHGVCWVDLASVTDTQALPAAVAAALGLTLRPGDPLPALCAAVAPLAMLVALDNAEHLLDGTAQLAQALLDGAPALHLVVTSQAPLKLAAECVYRLDALGVPQGPLPLQQALAFGAVALFAARARQADARFALDDASVGAVITLCRKLDGLALAVELAAARAPMLGVQQLSTSMDERLRLLTGGRNRVAPARQQTLRATLEWSHGFLDDTERTVFRRLAVFAGSGSLAMVQQIVADPAGEGPLDGWAVLDALAVLVDRSLVVAFTTDEGEPRYRLQETPRLFALERLQEAGEEDRLRQRHAQAFAERFDAAWDENWSGEIGKNAWRDRLAADIDNGWQAWECAAAAGDRTRALRIAATLLLAHRLSNHAALVALCERCEPWLDGVLDADLHTQVACGMMTVLQRSSLPRSERLMRAALARLADAQESPRRSLLSYLAHAAHSVVLAGLGRPDEAQAALAAAWRFEDARWPPHRRTPAQDAAYHLASATGDHAQALHHLQRAAAFMRAAGGMTWVIEANLVDLQLAAGDAAAAVATGQALVTSLAGSRIARALAAAHSNLAAAWLALDDTVRARAELQAGWPLALPIGYAVLFVDYLALLAALESRPRAAASLAGFADATNAAVGPRQHNEAQAIERASTLARAALGDAQFERLHAEGSTLGEAEIAAIAFATEDGD